MRIAFYAPMKSPDHAVPSGDRRMARGLMAAMRLAGHQVELASTLRAWARDPAEQAGIAERAREEVERLVQRPGGAASAGFDLWFTYHLYYRAPDHIGPPVAEALGIPYVAAEASFAMKRAGGEWALGHDAVERALAAARVVFSLKPGDVAGLRKARGFSAETINLSPFLDMAVERLPGGAGACSPGGMPVLLAVGMMRARAKIESYRFLAAALAAIGDRPWRLVIVGDGEARDEVEAAFSGFEEGRVDFRGALAPEQVAACYAAADLLVWPGLGEAFGMIYLEAGAAGLPSVATASGGVGTVVEDGVSGVLVAPGNPEAYANAIAALLDDADRRARLSESARSFVRQERSLSRAAAIIDSALAPLVTNRAASRDGAGRRGDA